MTKPQYKLLVLCAAFGALVVFISILLYLFH